MVHCTMARSLSAWLRCFLALYPGRRNSIFLFLASILFLCFLSFFLAAMSGLATAWTRKTSVTPLPRIKLLCGCGVASIMSVCFGSVIPAWLCVVCAPLASVKTPFGQQRRPARISPVLLVSSAARSAPAPGSLAWGLDRESEMRLSMRMI